MILPGMVAAIQRPDRRVCGVHRVFLRGDGRGKALVSQPKMTLGPIRGGAVRLGPGGPELGICEGIESGLSAQELYRITVWCGLGGSNMRNIELPIVVERVIVFGDNGAIGRGHAERAAKAFHGQGHKVPLVFPNSDFDDFNSVLKARAGRGIAE
jgi:hypothetical protein